MKDSLVEILEEIADKVKKYPNDVWNQLPGSITTYSPLYKQDVTGYLTVTKQGAVTFAGYKFECKDESGQLQQGGIGGQGKGLSLTEAVFSLKRELENK